MWCGGRNLTLFNGIKYYGNTPDFVEFVNISLVLSRFCAVGYFYPIHLGTVNL